MLFSSPVRSSLLALVVGLLAVGCVQDFEQFRDNGGGGSGVGGSGGSGGADVCANVDCDDDNPCTQDICDTTNGECLHPVADVFTVPQVDGDCKEATCEGTEIVQNPLTSDVPADDGNDCTSETCTGDMPAHPPVPAGDPCNDGAGVCNATGLCSDCDDVTDCGLDTACAVYACNNNTCEVTYDPGALVSGGTDGDCKALQCEDLNADPQLLPFLTDIEDDLNPCTTDTCTAAGDPNHENVGAGISCSDNLFCNGADTCNGSGVCVSAGNPCTGGGECADACNEAADNCFDASGTACGSNNNTACSNPDTCDGAGACNPNNEAAGFACNDNMFCNGADTCNGTGNCTVHAGDPCAGGAECANSCNEAADNCFVASGTACGSNANTACSNPDTCNGTGSCSPNNEAAGTACSDGVFCNGVDTCNAAGACISPGNPCPGHNTGPSCDDSCNEGASACTAADAATTVCNEDADLTNGACDGTLVEPNCAGD